ncbi:unnamed protein product [Owenia fusiformis]|uniref:Uncharacterized protein n=1 Tax=Owenia fusiformis TaxID=6347 RepID=A0A8J1TUH5_OWEFU|nr:unnamed protein product [Owenia fusiformis]
MCIRKMQGQTLVTRFIICLVILSTIETVQCGLVNKKLRKLLEQAENKKRMSTTVPTTSVENIVLNDVAADIFANQVQTKHNSTYTDYISTDIIQKNDTSEKATTTETPPNETDRVAMSFDNVSNDDIAESTSTQKVKTTVNTTLAEENTVNTTETQNENISENDFTSTESLSTAHARATVKTSPADGNGPITTENDTTTPVTINTTIFKNIVHTNESPTDIPDISDNIIPKNASTESMLTPITSRGVNTTTTEQNNIETDELSNNNAPGDKIDDTAPIPAMTTVSSALTGENGTDATQLQNVPGTNNVTSTRPTTTTVTEAARTAQSKSDNSVQNNTVVLPKCKRSGTFMVDTSMDECHFLSCNAASRKYQREKCPSNRAVPSYYMKGKKKRAKEYRYVPCIKPSSKCRGQKPVIERPVIRKCGIDIVFAVDVSCSITDSNKRQIQNFLMSIADVITIGPVSTRIGIIAFAKQIFHVALLNNTQNKFHYKRTVNQMNMVLEPGRNLRRDCGTATNEALRSVRLEYFTPRGGDRPDKQNILVVLSDGLTVPKENKNKTLSEAQMIRDMNIPSYVMGLPNQRQLDLGRRNIYIGDEEWYAIASAPENVFKMEFKTMSRKIALIADQVCTEET